MVSGIQREVWSLYRRALRLRRTKPAAAQAKFDLMSRYSFRTNAKSVSPRDIGTIEHLMRQGRKKLEMYEDTSVKDCWVSKEMVEWGQKPGNKSNTKP